MRRYFVQPPLYIPLYWTKSSSLQLLSHRGSLPLPNCFTPHRHPRNPSCYPIMEALYHFEHIPRHQPTITAVYKNRLTKCRVQHNHACTVASVFDTTFPTIFHFHHAFQRLWYSHIPLYSPGAEKSLPDPDALISHLLIPI